MYNITYIYIYIYKVLRKNETPILNLESQRRTIIISQTSLYLSTFGSSLMKFSNEIDLRLRSSGFSKKCRKIFG